MYLETHKMLTLIGKCFSMLKLYDGFASTWLRLGKDRGLGLMLKKSTVT